MQIEHFIHLPYTLAGFVVGALVGLTGVGGGSLMTPLLVLLFGIHPATAVGTDLLYAGITKFSGSAVHHRNGSIDWRSSRRLAAGSVPAALATLVAAGPLRQGIQVARARRFRSSLACPVPDRDCAAVSSLAGHPARLLSTKLSERPIAG